MHFTVLDWSVIGIFFTISLGIGIYMSKRASRGMTDFFLSGRNLPWYIAGTSMVATTFAADTPLAVAELVSKNGIAGNWLWWNMVFGGMMTVFFFARLWRRSGIVTDAEFVSIRYSGKPASFLRGFRAVYIGIFMNVIVIAWVNLAMAKILKVIFPEFTIFGLHEIHFAGITFSSHLLAVGGLMIFTAIYSSLSGLWGVTFTDSFQFVVAMTGCIILAIFAVNHPNVGGISGLKQKLPEWVFNFLPGTGSSGGEFGAAGLLKMSTVAFVAYLGVQWWSSWYPGAEPGGGGYVAQRMLSAKDERHSLLATLWFQVAHFAIRPWPWIIAALSALIIYPNVPDKGAAYVMLIRDLMPSGLLGLLIAAFLAAYMSCLSSQTIWGTSYIINDLYKPFIAKKQDEKMFLKISRLTTVVLMLFSLVVTTQFTQISDAWKFVLACSGGIGPVLILRWYWWRINAWSELSAMLAPYVVYPILVMNHVDYETSLIIIVAWSTAVWLTVTFLTKPEKTEILHSFYEKIHPGGIGWKKISAQYPEIKSDTGFGRLFVNWFMGCIMVLFFLFALGKIIFQDYTTGFVFAGIALAAGAVIFYNLTVILKKSLEIVETKSSV